MDVVFGEIKLYLPETIEAINAARTLLSLIEDRVVSGWVCKHCGCTKPTPYPKGRSWAAPNVCSRCAEENAPEIPEPKTFRNVSLPARESSATAEENLKCPDPLKDLAKQELDKHDSEQKPYKITISGKGRIAKRDVVPQPILDILSPKDMKLCAFEYDADKLQQYKTLFFQELPDGRVVLEYINSHYYTSKEAVMQIPYPFQKGYFSKETGWSSTVEQAFRTYRQYLAEQEREQRQQKEKEIEKEKQMSQNRKQKQEDPDDWKYKPILQTNTRTNYDGNKIEGSLEI